MMAKDKINMKNYTNWAFVSVTRIYQSTFSILLEMYIKYWLVDHDNAIWFEKVNFLKFSLLW